MNTDPGTHSAAGERNNPERNGHSPESIYGNRLELFGRTRDELLSGINRIGILRLASFALLAGSVVAFLATGSDLFIPLIPIMGGLFVFLVIRHSALRRRLERIGILIGINRDCLERLGGGWTGFPDRGDDFMDERHPFSPDLDIFGKDSLYQWTACAGTDAGRKSLARRLSTGLPGTGDIRSVQEAILELSPMIDFRQDLQAAGTDISGKNPGGDRLFAWAEGRPAAVRRPLIRLLCIALPALTALSIAGAFALPRITMHFPLALMLLQLGITVLQGRKAHREFSLAESCHREIGAYRNLLGIIEKEEFRCPCLRDLRGEIDVPGGKTASGEITRLEGIIDFMNLRFSSLHLFINMITLWDCHCLLALERWRSRSGDRLRGWIGAIGEFESLSSLALIAHDNPGWAMPLLREGEPLFRGSRIGHPLIHRSSRVCNDFALGGSGAIAVITGSNMSGKSTLLRTVGINMALACAGAPVCAGFLECTPLAIFTSMRVRDNLERSISSFYAELIRVGMILRAAKEGTSMIFLIDEIFRGTNSRDRKRGARALMKALSRGRAAGMIATHDLELVSDEGDGGPEIMNFHFREQYRDGELFFDYLLRGGVCRSSDALYLMRSIGLEVED